MSEKDMDNLYSDIMDHCHVEARSKITQIFLEEQENRDNLYDKIMQHCCPEDRRKLHEILIEWEVIITPPWLDIAFPKDFLESWKELVQLYADDDNKWQIIYEQFCQLMVLYEKFTIDNRVYFYSDFDIDCDLVVEHFNSL